MTRRWLTRALGGALLLLAFGSAGARADTSVSTNWAGYVAHRSGVRFNRVIATWRQPDATCVAGSPTFSAMWVGLGGYSSSSAALEQIGSETDCSASGRMVTSAWYEMVPAPSHNLSLPTHAGDLMRGAVSVSGEITTLTLANLTRHASVSKRVRTSQLDLGSAEWILEAPSECNTSGSFCETLPLTDFGRAAFSDAAARTTTGHTGAISGSRWGATEIRLLTGGDGRGEFVQYRSGAGIGTATPSALTSGHSAFSLRFSATDPEPDQPEVARAASLGPGARIVHPLR